MAVFKIGDNGLTWCRRSVCLGSCSLDVIRIPM